LFGAGELKKAAPANLSSGFTFFGGEVVEFALVDFGGDGTVGDDVFGMVN